MGGKNYHIVVFVGKDKITPLQLPVFGDKIDDLYMNVVFPGKIPETRGTSLEPSL